MKLRLITETKYILQAPGSWTVSYQETGTPAKWSSFPPQWKKEKCHPGQMNDRWVISIYEVENAHTDLLSCLSLIEMCLCLWACAKDGRSERKKKHELFPPSSVIFQAIFFNSAVPPCPCLWSQRHCSFTLLTSWQVFIQKRACSLSSSRCSTTSLLSQKWGKKRECACVTWSWIKTNPAEMYSISKGSCIT